MRFLIKWWVKNIAAKLFSIKSPVISPSQERKTRKKPKEKLAQNREYFMVMLVERSTRGAFVFVFNHFHHHQHPNFPSFPTFPYQKIRSESATDFSFDFFNFSYFGGMFILRKEKLASRRKFFFVQYSVCAEHGWKAVRKFI
jgi:hypothetical protein